MSNGFAGVSFPGRGRVGLILAFLLALSGCGGGGGGAGAVAAATAPETAAASTTPPTLLASISAAQPCSSMSGHYVQALGSSHALSGVSETAGIAGADAITGPPTVGASTLRFGKVADPLDPSRTVFYMAAKASDGTTFGHLGRVEIGLDDAGSPLQKSGVTYWIAGEIYIPATRFAAGNGTVLQIHNSMPTSAVFGPFALGFQVGVFPNPGMTVVKEWSSQSDPGQSGFNEQLTYPWVSNNAGFPALPITDNVAQTFGAYPTDQWVQYVCKYRGDPSGTTGLLQVWMRVNGVTTQIVDLTNVRIGTAAQGYPLDYVKSGLDDYQYGGGDAGTWELRRSLSLFQDNGNTAAQVLALMP